MKESTMPMPIQTVSLKEGNGTPTIEIIFGHAHVGSYRMFLWDPNGKNPEQVSHGNNIDDVLDTFEMPVDSAGLERFILSYEVIVQAAEARDGQIYSITITVRQGGQVVPGGLIQENGTFRDVKSLIGFCRFEVTA
jgi:hypothetical protein